MNIHEFQAKRLLASFGVAINEGDVAQTPLQAEEIAQRLLVDGCSRVVVKAQIHAGGRGKGTFKSGFQGGVKLTQSAKEAGEIAGKMLNQVLVTKQTGSDGRLVRQLLIETATEIQKEFYLAVLLDRGTSRPVVMVSTEGGMDIEEVAAKSPEKIIRESVDPLLGLRPYQARNLAVALGLKGDLLRQGTRLIQGVYQAWWDSDASLMEINPLAVVRSVDGETRLVAVDAKLSLDDNGLFRHPQLKDLRDLNEEAALEVEAGKHDLNYIKLDGDIACLVNGAGLAMATMDIIQHYGGRPANFLDVGGGAKQEQVTAAFKIIMSDPNVRGILINIFGGIMRCDVIAEGVVAAAHETKLTLPLVVRLEGNNAELGRKTLDAADLDLIAGESMADSARKIVAAVRSEAN